MFQFERERDPYRESVQDRKVYGSSQESVLDRQVYGSSQESVQDRQVYGISRESVHDRQVYGSSRESVQDVDRLAYSVDGASSRGASQERQMVTIGNRTNQTSTQQESKTYDTLHGINVEKYGNLRPIGYSQVLKQERYDFQKPEAVLPDIGTNLVMHQDKIGHAHSLGARTLPSHREQTADLSERPRTWNSGERTKNESHESGRDLTFKHIGLNAEESLIERRTVGEIEEEGAVGGEGVKEINVTELENNPDSLLGMWKEVNTLYLENPHKQSLPKHEEWNETSISEIDTASVVTSISETTAHVQTSSTSSAPSGSGQNQTFNNSTGSSERSATKIPVPTLPFRTQMFEHAAAKVTNSFTGNGNKATKKPLKPQTKR